MKEIYNKYLPPRLVRKGRAVAAYKNAAIRAGGSYVCIKITLSTISTWNYGPVKEDGAIALARPSKPYAVRS